MTWTVGNSLCENGFKYKFATVARELQFAAEDK
jgi:hypothetical protein